MSVTPALRSARGLNVKAEGSRSMSQVAGSIRRSRSFNGESILQWGGDMTTTDRPGAASAGQPIDDPTAWSPELS